MALRRTFGNQKAKRLEPGQLEQYGFTVEPVSQRSLKINRNGRFFGLLREAVGSCRWYPAGQAQPEFEAAFKEDVLRYLIDRHGTSH